MSFPERPSDPDGHPIMPVETDRVVVPRLRPDVFDPRKGFISGNFDSLMPQVLEALKKRPGFEALVKDIKEHKKSAIIVTSVGGLTLLVATIAGYEFGIRHGRDIRQLFRSKKGKVV